MTYAIIYQTSTGPGRNHAKCEGKDLVSAVSSLQSEGSTILSIQQEGAPNVSVPLWEELFQAATSLHRINSHGPTANIILCVDPYCARIVALLNSIPPLTPALTSEEQVYREVQSMRKKAEAQGDVPSELCLNNADCLKKQFLHSQEISRRKPSRNLLACSSILRRSASGISPCSPSQIAKALFRSECRRSVCACSCDKEPFAIRSSIRPRNSTPNTASWPLISGSLVGNKSSCFGKLALGAQARRTTEAGARCF